MAKKQGISYSPNTALIQGAGVAYKNYDNAPGMYSGLDTIIEAGTGMMEGAVKEFEAEEKKIEEEAKAAELEKAKQDKDWYDISGSVYENAGSFMKDVEYKDTVSQLTALKPRLIAARKSGNPEEIAAVMTEFNNIKSSVDDHKAFRETITNPEYGISDAMKHSGIVPGDNGEDHNFLTGLVKEEYKIVRKGGQTYYNVGGVEKTMKQIKDMTILKDLVPFNAYQQRIEKQMGEGTYDEASTSYYVRNNIVPSDVKGLRAFVADNGFNGETLLGLFNKPLTDEQRNKGLLSNKEQMKKEILNSAFNTDSDKANISETEWKNFTNAIIDPKNEFWKGDEQAWQKSTTDIVTKQLTNGIGNAWIMNQKPTTPPPSTLGTAEERAMQKQADTFKAALQSKKKTNFQISQEVAISVDPVTKTITEFTTGGEQKITPQKAIDLLVKKAGYFNAEQIFGDIGDWNKESLPVKKSGKPGTMLGRFFNSFASDNIE